MEVSEGIIDLEETDEFGGLMLERKHKGCGRCFQIYDKFEKSEEKCVLLELDIRKQTCALEYVEGKLAFTELENINLKREVGVLRQKKEALEKIVRSREDGVDNLRESMIEKNKVLECEKKRAETELSKWKLKCEELEKQLLLMKSGGPSMVQTRGKPKGGKTGSAGTSGSKKPCNQHTQFEGYKGGCEFELKSCLGLSGQEAPRKNMSPLTPAVRDPYAQNDHNDNSNAQKSSSSVGLGVSSDKKTARATVAEDHSSDDDKPICYRKRKFQRDVAYVVSTSESESSCDDNIPIGMLRNRRKHKKNTPRRRLQRMSDKRTENRDKSTAPAVTIHILDEDETEKDDSGSLGDSLGGFIVTSSDDSKRDDSFSDMAKNESMSSDVAYDEVISSLGRERKDKKTWEYEAEMLADLAKCPELCMKGVCAIYRRQTSEEKICQATLSVNGRGFSQYHAFIGSELAEFLTDEDPHGDVKKTVKELLEYNSEGVEKCRMLAMRYSKQLFEIYKKCENPFFHP